MCGSLPDFVSFIRLSAFKRSPKTVNRVPTLLLRKNSITFQDTQNVYSRILYTACALVNLL